MLYGIQEITQVACPLGRLAFDGSEYQQVHGLEFLGRNKRDCKFLLSAIVSQTPITQRNAMLSVDIGCYQEHFSDYQVSHIVVKYSDRDSGLVKFKAFELDELEINPYYHFSDVEMGIIDNQAYISQMIWQKQLKLMNMSTGDIVFGLVVNNEMEYLEADEAEDYCNNLLGMPVPMVYSVNSMNEELLVRLCNFDEYENFMCESKWLKQDISYLLTDYAVLRKSIENAYQKALKGDVSLWQKNTISMM